MTLPRKSEETVKDVTTELAKKDVSKELVSDTHTLERCEPSPWFVTVFQGFILAMLLMTRIPILKLLPLNRLLPLHINGKLKSISVLFYPLVGTVIAACIWAVYMILPASLPTLLQASLLVAVWVALTGAIHLDGLADAVDAAFASHKPKAQTLDIFRDPNAGPMAIVTLILVLLLKVVALDAVLQALYLANGSLGATSIIPVTVFVALMSACVLGRISAVVLIATTPYARKNGMAEGFDLTPYRVLIIALCIFSMLALWFFDTFFFHANVFGIDVFNVEILNSEALNSAFKTKYLSSGVIVLLCLTGLSLWLWQWRRFWLRTIDGYTGDCVGALIEVAELIVLLAIVLGMHAGGSLLT